MKAKKALQQLKIYKWNFLQVDEQEEKITELEVENKQHEAQLMSLQQSRPKTAMQRPKTPQVNNYWPRTPSVK